MGSTWNDSHAFIKDHGMCMREQGMETLEMYEKNELDSNCCEAQKVRVLAAKPDGLTLIQQAL